MKKCIAIAVCIGFLSMIISCATIIRGKEHTFPITSDVPATIKFIGLKDGVTREIQTPATIKLKRHQGYKVIVEAEGYDTQEFEITSKGDWGWLIIGDLLLFGGVVGLIIDVGTNAYRTLNPKELNLQFANSGADVHVFTPDSTVDMESSKRYLISLNAQ